MDKISKILDGISDTLMKMPKEEFEKLIEESMPKCTPETCYGECQGLGWCEVAVSFRENRNTKNNGWQTKRSMILSNCESRKGCLKEV